MLMHGRARGRQCQSGACVGAACLCHQLTCRAELALVGEQLYDAPTPDRVCHPVSPRETAAVCLVSRLVSTDAPHVHGGAQIQIMVISREFLVMARHNLIPSWFAYVNAYTGTPLRITLIFGCIKGAHARCLYEQHGSGCAPKV